ncbi:hypothetical protein HK407_04g07780 [Ordospora pajunii]|uniref:uncharacterized protein n=1 Tax=Ordospora pajunii TaxID=3039483 RepID=UPI00295281D0|nr:uncharacterized protein HK407_04g07780 [Ordospora pajunii]KAH9411670.1 hypothetical protein HK407_04g07780 [Ordospora pajunii]
MKMENVKRIEDEIRNEDDKKKEDARMLTDDRADVACHHRKRKIAPIGLPKKKCVLESTSKEEAAELICRKCSKKLKLTNNYGCRCGNVYCASHRFHDQHECTFDYKAIAIAKLKLQNPKINEKKISD